MLFSQWQQCPEMMDMAVDTKIFLQKVEEILSLPEGLRAFAIVALGYPAEERKPQDRFHEDRIHFV